MFAALKLHDILMYWHGGINDSWTVVGICLICKLFGSYKIEFKGLHDLNMCISVYLVSAMNPVCTG